MRRSTKQTWIKMQWLTVLFVSFSLMLRAADGDFPPKPNPPRLVNDYGHFLTDAEAAQLEQKLELYNDSTSTEITIVTIKSLGDYDVSDYAIRLGNLWGVGKAGKNNGVMILASMDDHKVNISTGKGMEGVLTDALCGRIIRNEIVPAFKEGNYYQGFSNAVDAIIAASKGEYKADDNSDGKDLPIWAVLLLVGFIYFIIWLISKIRGGGGTYMSRGGYGGWWMGGGGWGGGSSGSGGGGGFGGFGGGGFGGGGASGSW